MCPSSVGVVYRGLVRRVGFKYVRMPFGKTGHLIYTERAQALKTALEKWTSGKKRTSSQPIHYKHSILLEYWCLADSGAPDLCLLTWCLGSLCSTRLISDKFSRK
jgi:hypothetical protein